MRYRCRNCKGVVGHIPGLCRCGANAGFDLLEEGKMSDEHQVTEFEMAWKWVEGEVEANGYCCFATPFLAMLREVKDLDLKLATRRWAIARNFSSGADVDEYVVYRRKA